MRYSLLLFFCLQTLTFKAQDVLSEKNYKLYSVQRQQVVPVDTLIEDMKDAEVLFFGEEHNDSVTHYMEKQIFSLLFQRYGERVALSLEMFDRDVQTVMDEYLDGMIREKNFTKDARVWSNYRDYRPMVEWAREHHLNVVCANAPTRYTNLAGRKGQEALLDLSPDALQWIAPLPYDTATGAYYEKLTGMMGGHSSSKDTANKVPVMNMPAFHLVTAQSLWDATMAWSIHQYLRSHRKALVMQVNGKFHSDEGFAVVSQLEQYRPGTRYLILSSASDEKFPDIHWPDYSANGDYILITDPAVPKTYKD